jgi:hypothetical protein
VDAAAEAAGAAHEVAAAGAASGILGKGVPPAVVRASVAAAEESDYAGLTPEEIAAAKEAEAALHRGKAAAAGASEAGTRPPASSPQPTQPAAAV